MNDRVTINIEDGVADVRMIRTDKMNALDNAMFEALVNTGERLKTEKGVRAVVLSGEGRAFCAGLDMGNFGRMAEGPRGQSTTTERSDQSLGARTHGVANRAQYACWVWREVPVPVIAAVHGNCLGGGLQIALGADIRIFIFGKIDGSGGVKLDAGGRIVRKCSRFLLSIRRKMIFDVLRVQLRNIELFHECDHLGASEITERVAGEAQTKTRRLVRGWLRLSK